MSIFKKRNLSTSDDYYYAYKENLVKKGKSKTIYSLNNIIKFEFFTLVTGLLFMSYNDFFGNFSIEFQGNSFHSNIMLSQETSVKDTDSLLEEQLRLAEVDTILPIFEIKEEDIVVEEQVAILSEKLNINTTDMSLLVEIIKSQLHKPSKSIKEDKVILSQI